MNDFLRAILFLPPQASSVAFDIDRLHYFVIIVTMIGSTAVFLVATWWLIRFRRRGDRPATPRVQMPAKAEVALIGGTLGLFLLWWVIGFVQYIHQQVPPADATRIYVTGKQWMWKFAYPGGRSSINVLTVPVDRPVRLVMTSRDVIHSFYVPAFRMKQDVVPGTYTSLWFEATEPGVYPAYCAEYCGLQHSRMRAAVVALDANDYEEWLKDANREPAPSDVIQPSQIEGDVEGGDMVREGLEASARHGCLACHTVDGQRHIGPTWAGLYGRVEELVDAEPVLVDEAYLTRSMMDPHAQIVRGYQPVMPSYQGALTAAETGAIVELIRSLRDVPLAPVVELPPTRVPDAGPVEPREELVP